MSTELITGPSSPLRTQDSPERWTFRCPTRKDGIRIHDLIASCPPLDENSSYCNFLQSHHFDQTCIVAESEGEIVGFISAYLKPDKPNELFVWQVAVSQSMRGKGLAFTMLKRLLGRDTLKHLQVVETTITASNKASWRLFEKLDSWNGNQGEVSIFLDRKEHFMGRHDTEHLYRIPLQNIS
ncbi:diaminobutyrate acetyltransferase [Veronia pacifica]|uniref:L-2,4-diaminobutyric acid acetyltransferase n=1 Tax=Veronia pacifica TaxID=1080227 RepID=A0A1C3EAR2_9GAMM|nr:diaminobutyrate acetyltransferase [Veronia pacifica]ODA30290.1 diaminobutyrate acetyltransferase [Veronia pacifica]